MKNEYNIKPILKWVGGKRKLFNEINKRIPKKFNTYVEPFFGGGAILFALQPDKGIINDLNSELINVYQTIKNTPDKLINQLKKLKNTKEDFYKIRSLDRDKNYFNKLNDIEKAARIIYLNKTCYNGLYRVNSNGELNSPFGKYKNPLICDEQLINELSKFLNQENIEINNMDYEKLLNKINKGDFVYLDPPYDPISDSSNFTGYTNNGFNKNEQKRLKAFCDNLNKKGAYFMISNSNTEFINELYKEYKIDIIYANRNISCKGEGRTKIEEVLIRNYE